MENGYFFVIVPRKLVSLRRNLYVEAPFADRRDGAVLEHLVHGARLLAALVDDITPEALMRSWTLPKHLHREHLSTGATQPRPLCG